MNQFNLMTICTSMCTVFSIAFLQWRYNEGSHSFLRIDLCYDMSIRIEVFWIGMEDCN